MDTNPDPASLQNLNDIVSPEAIGWWPLAPGWYVLLALAAVLGLWATWRMLRRRRADRYRREALAELAVLRMAAGDPKNRTAALGLVGTLLKRTALAVLHRDQIAELSGAEWHRRLDMLASIPLFAGETGQLMDRASYGYRTDPLSDGEANQLMKAADSWLRLHNTRG